MSRFCFFIFFFFLFGLDEKIEKKGREREKEKIYHIITMMMKMMFCFTRNIRQERHKTAKKCADGLSDFDFSISFLPEIPS